MRDLDTGVLCAVERQWPELERLADEHRRVAAVLEAGRAKREQPGLARRLAGDEHAARAGVEHEPTHVDLVDQGADHQRAAAVPVQFDLRR